MQISKSMLFLCVMSVASAAVLADDVQLVRPRAASTAKGANQPATTAAPVRSEKPTKPAPPESADKAAAAEKEKSEFAEAGEKLRKWYGDKKEQVRGRRKGYSDWVQRVRDENAKSRAEAAEQRAARAKQRDEKKVEARASAPSATVLSPKAAASGDVAVARKGTAATAAVAVEEPAKQVATGPKTKQQKLAELLEAYKEDKITPNQYQEQRARILSEQ